MNSDNPNGHGHERPYERMNTSSITRPLVFAAATLLLTTSARTQQVDDTRASIESWVETRRVISAEKRDWALGKELLVERIELVKREIDTLRGRIKSAEESIAEADGKREELVAHKESLEQASQSLAATVATLETRTSTLLARLPDWLRDRVRPLSQRFPEDPQETELPLSERFQNVVGVLDSINKLNRQITVTSELRTLPDGTTAEVTALYIGVGKGYYVTGDGKAAGIGTSTDAGWSWTPANDAAPQIAKTIAIQQDELGPEFVPLPMQIDGTDS